MSFSKVDPNTCILPNWVITPLIAFNVQIFAIFTLPPVTPYGPDTPIVRLPAIFNPSTTPVDTFSKPCKLNLLFHGIPGSGKTSLQRNE